MAADPSPPDTREPLVIDVEAEEVAADPEAVGNEIGDFFDQLGAFARQGGRVVKKLGGLAKKAEAVVGPLSRPLKDR